MATRCASAYFKGNVCITPPLAVAGSASKFDNDIFNQWHDIASGGHNQCSGILIGLDRDGGTGDRLLSVVFEVESSNMVFNRETWSLARPPPPPAAPFSVKIERSIGGQL